MHAQAAYLDVIAEPLDPAGDELLELAYVQWESATAIAARVCDVLRGTPLGRDALAGAMSVAVDAIADTIVSGVGRDDFTAMLRDSATRVTADLDRSSSPATGDPRVRDVAYRLRILALVHAMAVVSRVHTDEAAALDAALRIRGANVDPLADRRAQAAARRRSQSEHPISRGRSRSAQAPEAPGSPVPGERVVQHIEDQGAHQ